jgi:hypothetical protein
VALPTDLESLRRLVDEPDETTYSDTELISRLAASGSSLYTVARDVWGEKLAALSGLVNVSEGGSSRSMSQAFDHAQAMYTHFAGLVVTSGAPVLRKLTRL